jgi:hypothetical protein
VPVHLLLPSDHLTVITITITNINSKLQHTIFMGTMDIMEVMVIKAATTLLTFLILTFQNIIIPMEVMPFHFMVEQLSLSTLVIRTLLIITDTTDITNMVHFQKDILLTLIFMGFKTMDLMSIIAIWMLSLLVTS